MATKKRRSRSSRRSRRHGNSDAWVQEGDSRWTRGPYVITRTADGFVLKDWSVCGQCTRDTMAGDCKWLDDISPGRVQLNGFTMPPTPDFLALAKETARQRPLRFILQARELASFEPVVATAAEIGADVLYDPSGGRGVETAEWPTLPTSSVYMGYAGGIGPDNVDSVLNVLLSDRSRGDFWIDMESRVRTDDRLDLALVRDVLVKATRSGSGPAEGDAFEDYPDVRPKEHCQ
jgi:hypothetical protein